MSGAYATTIVQVAFSGGTQDAFRIDISTLASGDEIVDGFPAYDFATLGTYDDVSADTKSVEIERGREDTLQQYQAGRATIVLRDDAGNQSGTAGLYNPENSSSALAGSIVPMMAVRVASVYLGSTAELFRGFVTSWDSRPTPGQAYFETTIVAEDFYNWLNAQRLTITSGDATTTGEAIEQVLDSVEFSDPDFRDIDTGDALVAGSFTRDGTETALSAIADLLNTERGVFFIDKGGVATYRDRHTQSSQAVAGTVTASVHFGSSSIDINRIRNASTVTVEGGGTATYVDGDSAATYGRRDWTPITSSYITETQATSLAEHLALLRSSVSVDTRTIRLENTTALMPTILAIDVAERWEIVSAFGGGTVDAFVEAVSHEITPKRHTCEIVVSERAAGGEPFILGSSKVGSASDVLGY